MIKYTLKCSDGHMFDGWFGNSSAFDDQKDAGLVSCPYCGTPEIEKTLMTPTVTGTKMQTSPHVCAPEKETQLPIVADTNNAPTMIPEPLVHGDETMRAVVAKMRELRSWVQSNTENVGDKFAEQARKMHLGEEEHRGIFGKATFDEAQELIDDGVDFLPLPSLPEDNN